MRDKMSGWARKVSVTLRGIDIGAWRRPLFALASLLLLTLVVATILASMEVLPQWRAPSQVLATFLAVVFGVALGTDVGQMSRVGIKPWLMMWGIYRSLFFFWLILAGALTYVASSAPTRIDAESVVAQGSLLLAYGPQGEVDWATSFPSSIVEYSPLKDLDGDDVKETVVATEPRDAGGSWLVILDDDGREVRSRELSRDDMLVGIPSAYVDYGSRAFEVTDLLVEELDGTNGQEILLLANYIGPRRAPSLILGLTSNLEVAAWYWHFGRLREAHIFRHTGSAQPPRIVVLGENPLVDDDRYAPVAFALLGREFFSADGPTCWNLTTTMSSRNLLGLIEDLDMWRADDPGVLLGCQAVDAGALAWYRWIELSGVTLEDMSMGWLPLYPGLGLPREERWLVTVVLSDGCQFGIDEYGEIAQALTPEGGCRLALQPVWIHQSLSEPRSYLETPAAPGG